MFRTARVVFAMAALVSAGALVQAQGGPGMGQGIGQGMGPGFGEHRPPMERALGPRGARGQWWNDPQIVEKLKLTDDQRKTMDQILLAHREKLIDMRANVEKAELAMEPLMKADQPNEGQILAQIDKVAQARAELEKANARFLLALRAKLSPDQWKELQAARAERRDWRRDGPRQPGRPGMPPLSDRKEDGQPPAPDAPAPQGMLIQPLELESGA